MNPGKLVVGTAAILALCATLPAQAQIAGFGGTNWTLNSDPMSVDVPVFTNNVLLLGTNAGDATSAFYGVPQYIGSFTASFVFYNAFPNDEAGFVFVLQNEGPNAVGNVGGNFLGFKGMTSATGIAFNVDSTGKTQPGLGYAPTQVPGGGPGGYISTAPVDFHQTNPIAVSLSYASDNLAVTVTDTVTLATFTTNFLENLTAATGGGTTGYVGFTGGGTGILDVSISNFVFNSQAPPNPKPTP